MSIKQHLCDIENMAREGREDYACRGAQEDIDTYNDIISHVRAIWEALDQHVVICVKGGVATVESCPASVQVTIEDFD